MGMMFGNVYTGISRRVIYDRNGFAVGQAAYSKRSGKQEKPKKTLPYRYKEISTLILRSKTSGSAGQAVIRARAQAANLRKKLRTGEYDDQELEDAIIHADKMVRIAKKRQKHLKEEENAKRLASEEDRFNREEESDEDLRSALEDSSWQEDGAAMDGEEMRRYQKELQKQMRQQIKEMQEQMQEEMQEMMREFGKEEELEELSEELGKLDQIVSKPKDLEELKRKHRQEELRDIIKADMEYLRAFFGRLEKEKQEASNGRSCGGVSLELGGMDIPVETAQAPPMAVEAVSVDEVV